MILVYRRSGVSNGNNIWQSLPKTYYFDKKLKTIQLDPMRETADIDTSNNFWSIDGSSTVSSKFDVFKQKKQDAARGAAKETVNPMQAAK